MNDQRGFQVVYSDGTVENVKALRYEIRDGFVLFHTSEARFDDLMSPRLAVSASVVRRVSSE